MPLTWRCRIKMVEHSLWVNGMGIWRTRDSFITWIYVFRVIGFLRSVSSSSLCPNMLAVRLSTFRTGILTNSGWLLLSSYRRTRESAWKGWGEFWIVIERGIVSDIRRWTFWQCCSPTDASYRTSWSLWEHSRLCRFLIPSPWSRRT